MMEDGKDQDIDVGSVVEAVSADHSFGAPLYVVDSMCMRCGENGTSRFLVTLIPHFRKVLISAFECPHCGERNNEVQFAGEIQPKGCCYHLEVLAGDVKIFDRQVVKSESATIKIPELDFEIPPEAQRGSLSTVEGILARAADELSALQEERKKVDPKTAEAIDLFLYKLRACAKAETPFTFILDDPAGNSFVENPHAPSPDPSLTIRFYKRTPEQQATLGYSSDPSQAGQSEGSLTARSAETASIPHGTIGATAGHRAIAQSNSTDISDNLFRYSAPEEVTSDSIFDRQVVKSESATIKIPELDFEIPPEAQRGSLSTVEGILARAADELSALQEERKKVDSKTAEAIDQFLYKLRACAKAETPFTFVLDDPAGNSFVENPHAPSPDPSLTIKFYDRTLEQQATLGYLADPSQAGHSEGSLATPSGETASIPHGTIGATAGHRAIAQSNSTDISDNLFRYSAPEEVMTFPSTCGACMKQCETRMFVTSILSKFHSTIVYLILY
ncbi:hypothetical protein F2Q69_00000932 [Brassica cretica]|uniref:Zinc finger ZPR1-type domain-containing protein n=1 Tax=Brassica cretica TaxID=69181 RepID=A0A8S9PEV5_BRACR|nr:hypothetical protein F2Q69_00000932 [Brassica cretica]